jgi:hypothetical protein
MSVALAETTMIALHGRFDQARRVAGGSFELILTEAESDFARDKTGELRRDAAFGRDVWITRQVALNRGTNQLPQLVVGHSTHSS